MSTGLVRLRTSINRLDNQVILITGSVTGIDKAIAKRCVAEGAKVLVHGLEVDLGQETPAEEDAPQLLIEKAVSTFGKLEVLVNNVAQVDLGNIHDTEAKWFRACSRSNAWCLVSSSVPPGSSPRNAAPSAASLRFGAAHVHRPQPTEGCEHDSDETGVNR